MDAFSVALFVEVSKFVRDPASSASYATSWAIDSVSLKGGVGIRVRDAATLAKEALLRNLDIA